MENIKEIKATDTLTFLTKTPSNSIHAITADKDFDEIIAKEAYRVLRHGGFFLLMTVPKRMYQDGAILLKTKFKIIDSIHWLQTDTPDNSFTVHYLIDRMSYLDPEVKEEMKEKMKDLKIPKLRRSHIPIIVAQKPPLKSQTINHYMEGVGLVQSVKTASGRSAGNIFSTEFDIAPYYFLLPRIKILEKELFARAWSHILQQFTTKKTCILDITQKNQAVLACLYLDREYKTCLPLSSLESFLQRCGNYLTKKKTLEKNQENSMMFN